MGESLTPILTVTVVVIVVVLTLKPLVRPSYRPVDIRIPHEASLQYCGFVHLRGLANGSYRGHRPAELELG